MFATGRPQIGEIKVEFHSDKSKKMPKPATCPSILTLHVCHQTYDDFKKQMDNALLFESEGFHEVQFYKGFTRVLQVRYSLFVDVLLKNSSRALLVVLYKAEL